MSLAQEISMAPNLYTPVRKGWCILERPWRVGTSEAMKKNERTPNVRALHTVSTSKVLLILQEKVTPTGRVPTFSGVALGSTSHLALN